MKKLLSLFLAFAMIMSLFVSVMAAPADPSFGGLSVNYRTTSMLNAGTNPVFALDVVAHKIAGQQFGLRLQYDDTKLKPVNGNSGANLVGAATGVVGMVQNLGITNDFDGASTLDSWMSVPTNTKVGNVIKVDASAFPVATGASEFTQYFGVSNDPDNGWMITPPVDGLNLYSIHFTFINGAILADLDENTFKLNMDGSDPTCQTGTNIVNKYTIAQGASAGSVHWNLPWLEEDEDVLASEVTLNKAIGTAKVGGSTDSLTATITNAALATNKNVNWTQSSIDGGAVSFASGTTASGVANTITGVTAGTVTVTATAADGSGKLAAATITVSPAVAPPVPGDENKHIQFTVVPTNAPTPFSVGQISANELYAGEEYELKIALSELYKVGDFVLPLTFDNSVVEITGISKGAAYDNKWEHMIYVDPDQYPGKYLPYQLGTIPNDDYTKINTDGKILLDITKTGSTPVDIGPLADPDQADDSEVFFIVKFKVKDNAPVGSDPAFKGIEAADKLTEWDSFGWTYFDECGEDIFGGPTYDTKNLTVEFTNPLVAEKTLKVTIVDYTTKNKTDLKAFHAVDEGFTIDAKVTWNDDSVFPAIANDGVTWTATNGSVKVIDGVPTYVPEAGYTGAVTITATSKQDATKSDAYTFNIIDLTITTPAGSTDSMNMTDTPTKNIVSDFIGGTLPAGDKNVTWSVTKDGGAAGNANATLDSTTSLTPVFTPSTPGIYVLTVTSDTHPELSDTVIITVTENLPTYSLKGSAGLQSKSRNGNAAYGYTVPANRYFDKDIKVELVDTTTSLTVTFAYTDATGNYDLKVDPKVNIIGNGKFMLRFSRVGDMGKDGTIRNESYLYAELPLEVTTAIPAGANINIAKVVGLVAGSFMGNNADKAKITQSDVQTVKSFVGLVDSDLGYDTAADINEYGGIEGGDLNIVRDNVGKTKTLVTYKIN